MGLFVLQDTPVGYALFKAKSSKILKKDGHDIENDSVEAVCNQFKLKDFHKFDSAATALEQAAALIDGKVTPRLSTLLDTIKDEVKASLSVADPKLASAINKLPQLDLKIVSHSNSEDVHRTIRKHLPALIPGLKEEDLSTMALGLAHSISRHQLKFSPDKVDTMIVQAINLLDDLDKELNMYAMRVKEWYGWHFPEMARIVNDNLAYAKIIMAMGMRLNAADAELSEILPEEIEGAVKAAAEVSMGTEITTEDLENIQALAEQVISFTEYRSQLSNYLSARMKAIAPNLTALVGDLVGARLIAHSGSLMNLAKSPASTIQILGAEKALFRALKTKHDTPKYGLLYHASLVGQATGKNKGKIARVLATKAALGLRVDALADWSQEGEGKGDMVTDEERSAFGVDSRIRIERRLAALEGKPIRPKGVAIAPNGVSHQPAKWEVKEARKYNPDADGLAEDAPPAAATQNGNGRKLIEDLSEQPSKKAKKSKKGNENGLEPMEDIVKDAMQEDVDGSDSDDADSDVDMDDDSDDAQELLKEVKTTKLNGSKSEIKASKHEQDKLARKLAKKEKRSKHAEKPEKQPNGGSTDYAKLAEQAGLSVTRYMRKLERGEIQFGADGKPQAISKKDIKKARKAGVQTAAKPVADLTADKKRKRDDDAGEEVDKAEQKRKKKEAKRAAKAARVSI